jgi:hypothetical protein
MSIYRKKSAVINKSVSLNNQITTNAFAFSNTGTVSINATIPVNYTNTISTQYATTSDINAAYSIGQNWQHPISGSFDNNFMGVCWSSELGIFVKHSLAYSATSKDGLKWIVHGRFSGNLSSICWSPELIKFCVVAKNPTNNIYISSNGASWTNIAPPASSNCLLSSVCWSPELSKFCAVANYGGKVLVSSDGTNWTNSNTGVYDNRWNSVCWSPELGLFCAVADAVVGSNIQYVMISNDGITWRNAISGVLPNEWRSVCWSPKLGVFCAVASSGNKNERVMISNDGLNWRNAINVVDRGWHGICWAADVGLFCASGSAGFPDCIMISRDGLTWNSAKSSAVYGGDFLAVCWSPELSSFCAVGVSGGVGQRAIVTRQEYRLPTTTKNYYIPLVSSTGTPEIKTNASISYNINNNTLNLENLSTTNLPKCLAVPKNSTDLINKAYLNKYVGDYTQGRIYDDWTTDTVNGSLNWILDTQNNNVNYMIDSEPGHVGILRLYGTNSLSFPLYSRSEPDVGDDYSGPNYSLFNWSKITYSCYILRLYPDGNNYGFLFIGLGPTRIASNAGAYGLYRDQNESFLKLTINGVYASTLYTLNVNDLINKWVIFEIEITNSIPSFYITIMGETGRILLYQGSISMNTTDLVRPIIQTTSYCVIDVDYFELLFNNMSRA